MARSLSEEQFVEGLLAGLAILGQEFVTTSEDEHHRRFESVAEKLRELQESGNDAAAEMPHGLYSSGVTGRFAELDAALGRLQSGGLLGANNPLYPKVALNASPTTAHLLLDRFYSPPQAELLQDLARTYLNALVSA